MSFSPSLNQFLPHRYVCPKWFLNSFPLFQSLTFALASLCWFLSTYSMHLFVPSFSWLARHFFLFFLVSISLCLYLFLSLLIWWMADRGENSSDVVSLCPLSRKPLKYHPCIMQILHISHFICILPSFFFKCRLVYWMLDAKLSIHLSPSILINVSLPKGM